MTADQINQLIAQYGRPAFELAMKQVYIDATMGAVWGLALLVPTLIGAVLTARIVRRYFATKGEGPYYGSDDILAFLVGAGSTLVGLFALVCLSGLAVLLNPEYQALHLLVAGVK